jgi:prepilin-type N-terminal cleavage/methylation domain-containing protein
MNDHGYTLAEMLAALVIIGLAITGLAEAFRALRLTQAGAARAVAEERSLVRARRGLERVLQGEGPFKNDDPAGLKGGASGFVFDCRGGGRCGARIVGSTAGVDLVFEGEHGWRDVARLDNVHELSFSYQSGRGPSGDWPPKGLARTLSAVSLDKGPSEGGGPLLAAPVWSEQAKACAFDPIIQDCRTAGP